MRIPTLFVLPDEQKTDDYHDEKFVHVLLRDIRTDLWINTTILLC